MRHSLLAGYISGTLALSLILGGMVFGNFSSNGNVVVAFFFSAAVVFGVGVAVGFSLQRRERVLPPAQGRQGT